MPKFFPYKKAGISSMLNEIAGLLLAAVVILLIIVVFMGVYSIFFGGLNQGTQESLKKLASSITALDQSQETKCFVPLYIQPDWALVGWDRAAMSVHDECGGADLLRPGKCGSGTCICACDGDAGSLSAEDCLKPGLCEKIAVSKLTAQGKGTVIYGERCGIGGFGRDVGVQNYILTKSDIAINIEKAAEGQDLGVSCKQLEPVI